MQKETAQLFANRRKMDKRESQGGFSSEANTLFIRH